MEGYKGLANIGATCYMNSLLQTLFMTPQFRNAIYSWRHNEALDGHEQDSILFQLQKLFAKLETKFPADVDTRELVRSFQWGGQEALEQQDIQEFNRVLFDALEQSLRQSKGGKHEFLSELYEGIMLNYTRCRVCSYQHPREENFQDIIITVKNKYAKLYNDSVELGLQRYLKPETMDGSNLYFCEQCQTKVEADRFVKFIKLPKLMSLILQRFTFDYMTMSRQKLNDEVRFPWVLNMNNYMNGYEGIPQKLPEDKAVADFEEIPPTVIQRKPLVIKRSTFLKAGKKDAKLPNNIKNKPTPGTKNFLTEMRKKTGKVEPTIEVVTKQKYVPLTEEEELQMAMEESMKDMKDSTSTVATTTEQKQNIEEVKASQEPPKVSQQQPQQETKRAENGTSLAFPPLPPGGLPIPPPPTESTISSPPPALESKTVSQREQQKAQTLKAKKLANSQALDEFNSLNQQLIESYFAHGQMVYELFSILIHSGGAHQGHYYAFIKSFEDGKWYCFNDYNVTELNVKEMQEKVFGGKGGTNAYGLYYRLVDKVAVPKVPIPDYIMKLLDVERTKIEKTVQEKIQNEDKYIKLKIYYQLYVKPMEILNHFTLKECLEKAKQLFGADTFKDIKPNNIRLRLFNPINETKLETFTGRDGLTLQELKINSHKCLLIETKKDEEEFEDYVVGRMNIRVVLWGQGVQSLEESTLKTTKLSLESSLIMKQVQAFISSALNLNFAICIIKRHQNDEYTYHEIINTPDYHSKTLQEINVLQNQILFVQPDSDNLMWPKEFQAQVYRICIKYNLPTKQNMPVIVDQSIVFDSRMKLTELKQTICKKHGLDPSSTIFKRGSKSGLELKDLNDTLKDYRFISGTQLYLEEGIPAQPGQVRILLYMSTPTDLSCLNSFNSFEEIADIPVNGNLKAKDCKELFLKVLKKVKDIELDPSKIRIREKLAQRMTKIYRERPMREQQLIEKRMIAIEKLEKQENLDLKENVIYARVFDPENWTLGNRFEVVINKATTMHDLAAIINTLHPEISVENMQICKITALYKFSLLDLAEVDYFLMKDIDIPVTAEPLFVNNDGLIYIVKDKTKKLRELTRQEEKTLGGSLKQKTTKTSTYKAPKLQKGVKITVKKKQPEATNVQVQSESLSQAQSISSKSPQLHKSESMPDERV